MSTEDNRQDKRNTRIIRYWLPLIVFAVTGLIAIGCAGGGGSAGLTTEGVATLQEQATPSLVDMEQVLQAELERLGKSAMQAGVYSPPSGAANIPFDLHALLIDPDGEGGADALGVQLTWTERLVGDYNMDGLVNASDLTPLGQYYDRTVEYRDPEDTGGVTNWPVVSNLIKSTDGVPGWRLARVDGNGDGLINLLDITAIGQHWQEQLGGYRFSIQRFGSPGFVAIMDPRNTVEVLEVPFGWNPVLDGIEYYDQFVNQYKVNLPIDADAGETIRIEVVNAAGTTGDPVEIVIQRESPWWNRYQPLVNGRSDNIWPADWYCCNGEVVDVQTYLWEGVYGDLDGSGTVDHLDFAPTWRFINTVPEDYAQEDRALYYCADQTGDGIVSVSDISSIAWHWWYRVDAYAFGYSEMVMDPDLPGKPYIYNRPFDFNLQHAPELVELHLPATKVEDEITIYSIACGDPDQTYGTVGRLYLRNLTELSASFDSEEPLIAAITTAGLEFAAGDEIALTGELSWSRSGEITAYQWDLDGDGTYEISGVDHALTPDTAGEYTCRLRVTDDQSNSAEVEIALTVT